MLKLIGAIELQNTPKMLEAMGNARKVDQNVLLLLKLDVFARLATVGTYYQHTILYFCLTCASIGLNINQFSTINLHSQVEMSIILIVL